MKRTYRIKEYTYGDGMTQYEIQRKSIFGFWYNPDNVDAHTTGWYSDFNEAHKNLIIKVTPIKTKIVWQSKCKTKK